MRGITILLIFIIGTSFIALPSYFSKKWGFAGHSRINRVAVFTLPPEMIGFFKDHIEYMTEHAPDPDRRRYAVKGEAERHFIDIDHYAKPGEDPFKVMPRKWKDAVAKFTEDTLLAYGIVPWQIQKSLRSLQWAFENRNSDMILKYAGDLGHYVADAHVPLHTTENYNGLMTGQRGIHALWESRVVEINYNDYNYFVGKAKYIKNPLAFAWEAVEASHRCLDSVFGFEKELTAIFPPDKKYSYENRGRNLVKTYSYEFSQAYSKKLNGMIERRMRQAIIAVGSYWYTAWVNAGQPNLQEIMNKPPSDSLLQEAKKLEEMYRSNPKGFGREHD